MKHPIKFLFALILLAFICSSCDDDDDNASITITADDAAEYVAASLAIATYGATNNMNYVSDQIIELIDCNESESDTRTDTETSFNGNVTASFTISESYSRTCSGGVETITYNFNAEQTTTSELLDTDHNITGAWTIGGAEESSTTLTYNGSYSRGGEWNYSNEDNQMDDVTSSFVYKDVKANKSDDVIFEGTSTFLLIGNSTVYEPFTYEGDVVFQANNISIMTFSTGEQYEIDLNTGEVTPL